MVHTQTWNWFSTYYRLSGFSLHAAVEDLSGWGEDLWLRCTLRHFAKM